MNKPCPFCGGSNISPGSDDCDGATTPWYFMRCDVCGCRGPEQEGFELKDILDELRETWNERK